MLMGNLSSPAGPRKGQSVPAQSQLHLCTDSRQAKLNSDPNNTNQVQRLVTGYHCGASRVAVQKSPTKVLAERGNILTHDVCMDHLLQTVCSEECKQDAMCQRWIVWLD